MARKGHTKVIYKGTFISKQSLQQVRTLVFVSYNKPNIISQNTLHNFEFYCFFDREFVKAVQFISLYSGENYHNWMSLSHTYVIFYKDSQCNSLLQMMRAKSHQSLFKMAYNKVINRILDSSYLRISTISSNAKGELTIIA